LEFENPQDLLRRLKLGREEYCQRLLTMLILEGPYPRWNSRSQPSAAGAEFLRALYERNFGGMWPGDDAVFVDEFELPPRNDTERGGAPDYAVVWDDRLWLIELKTEKASHRPDQIPTYFDLAHHHYPDAAVEVLYVTPPMLARYEAPAPWGRYAHAPWTELAELIRSTWTSCDLPGQQAVLDGLLAALAGLDMRPAEWRAVGLEAPEPVLEAGLEFERSPLDTALEAAALTAEDGAQRAVEYSASNLEDLLSLRLAVRDALASSKAGSPLRHVRPWIWRTESTGLALTAAGREHGMEMRLSRYTAPLY
jgi:hypothetical protein